MPIEINKPTALIVTKVGEVYYVRNTAGETVASFRNKPTPADLEICVEIDKWDNVTDTIADGKERKVSARIFMQLFESVPPVITRANYFLSGEAVDHDSKGEPVYFLGEIRGLEFFLSLSTINQAEAKFK